MNIKTNNIHKEDLKMKILLVSIMLMAASFTTEKTEVVEPQTLVIVEYKEDGTILCGPAPVEEKKFYSEYEAELAYNSKTNEW